MPRDYFVMPARAPIKVLRRPYSEWSPEDVLSYYQHRTTVRYFPVVADPAQVTRDKIDGILTNCFEFNGELKPLPQNFEWKRNPSSDVEWFILLHKFYYATGLGMAFRETGDSRYVRKWIELTSSWIDSVPLDLLSSDVTGRRIQNWISAHYYFVTMARTPLVTPDFYLRFLFSLHQQVSYLRDHLTPARNHRTLELFAIFLAAAVFPEFEAASEWLDFATKALHENMRSDLLPDGVQCELSTDYHNIVLRNYLGVRQLSKLNNLELPEEMDSLIRKALEFSLWTHKPDGRVPSLSDGDTGSYGDLLEQGYELYGNPEFLYVASKGMSGRPPTKRAKAFPSSGYYILRSGWGDGAEDYEHERYLIFDCGPLGAGNHGHFDLLHFEMAAYGQSLIVDPGRYTYHEGGETNWRALFRGTAYHNTVSVDGRNQTRYEFHKKKFKIKGPEPRRELRSFVSAPDFDYIHGVCRSHEYDVIHERKILFVCPEYWIVSDLLLAPEVHDYDLWFHLSDKAAGCVSIDSDRGAVLIEAPHLLIAQSADPTVTVGVEEGYVSPTYGVKHPAPIVRFSRRAASVCFHTLLMPFRSEQPVLKMESIAVFRDGKLCLDTEASAFRVSIASGGRRVTDTLLIVHRTNQGRRRLANTAFDGELLFVRRNTSDEIIGTFSVPAAAASAPQQTTLKESLAIRR